MPWSIWDHECFAHFHLTSWDSSILLLYFLFDCLFTCLVYMFCLCFVYVYLQVFLERDAALGSPHHSCAILKMVCTYTCTCTCIVYWIHVHVLYIEYMYMYMYCVLNKCTVYMYCILNTCTCIVYWIHVHVLYIEYMYMYMYCTCMLDTCTVWLRWTIYWQISWYHILISLSILVIGGIAPSL